jgi:hypothetical protein
LCVSRKKPKDASVFRGKEVAVYDNREQLVRLTAVRGKAKAPVS